MLLLVLLLHKAEKIFGKIFQQTIERYYWEDFYDQFVTRP